MKFFQFALQFASMAWFVSGNSSLALEKKAVRVDDEMLGSWNAGASCVVRYYNACTGWIWCWSGFEEDDRLGLVAHGCCGGSHTQTIMRTDVFCCAGSPPGYGFTGTIAVHNVDGNDCPMDLPLASQAFLPTSVWAIQDWNNLPVGNEFAVVVTTSSDLGFPNIAGFATDHPATGPTGPAACDLCFPSDRPTRSFSFGKESSPICPGEPFFDGICNAELLFEVEMNCPVSVESRSWSSIKGLYR